MKITVAETAGFCFGVARAVKTVQEALERGEKIATLGPIIHNEQFTEYLEKQGARIISSVEEAQNDETVIIRSHGVPKKVEDELKQRGLRYIDATCPFVKKIHKLVSEHYEKGYAIIVIGDSSHPEVEGIVGWCEEDAIILEKEEDISKEIPQKPLCVVAQTTIHRNLWNFFREFLKSTCQNPLLFDTICSAT
ncbi:MAG: 4-hydroxy-3-methylbut-2-enyl diphosphate reductase, partial [Clostridia bacterium]|nr:4-hydroxy-3-methylbut-2-enyl diphosphate reductase [Clostridia bacterium]